MEGGVISVSSRRPHSSKAPAPPPPHKVLKCDPADIEITERDIPQTLSALHRKELLKQSREHAKEPQAVMLRKLEDEGGQGRNNQKKTQSSEECRPSLAHTGETLLAKFYGMLYTNDGSEKEWKLEVDGFIPICFIQAHGNANKPFCVIAVEGSKRIMEYHVNVNTTCARSKTFVKWQDGSAMFGAHFVKEDQAEQFVSTVSRMVSNINSFAQLMKKPERKEVIRKMSDPTSSSGIHHTKVSLLIKLPNKRTTVMSVPGLLTMNELFDMICDKEDLNRNEHQLALPRSGTRKVAFDSTTAVGSLNIREVSILRSIAAEKITETDDSIEDLLDMEGENKILKIHIPTGVKKSFRVPLDMTMRQLAMRVCSREGLNPRHHSLQYIDFKHEFLDMTCTVDEIGVGEIRLMDKRGNNIHKITKRSLRGEHRKSTGVELEPGASLVASRPDTGTKHHSVSSLQKSVYERELQGENQVKSALQDGQKAPEKEEPLIANSAVPLSKRGNSSDEGVKKKPPIPPLPYCVKSGPAPRNASDDLHGRDFRDHDVSPIKKNGGLYASSPDLSSASSESGEWPVSRNFKTSTPETKSKRRAAPPPPSRPARSKLAFYEHESTNKAAEKKGEESRLPAASVSFAGVAPVSIAAAAISQPKPNQKRRPAPPRPSRPPPPQSAPRRDTRQRSLEAKDTDAPEVLRLEGVNPAPHEQERKRSTPFLSLDLRKDYVEIDEDSGAIGWRGLPIFIAPPPPDELPPPLDECETPVGPLTELEADFLLEESVESTPVANNGVKIEEVPGKLKFRSDDNAFLYTEKPAGPVQVVLPPVQRTQPHDELESKDDVFPVLPPPNLYSEFSKASLESTDIVDKTDEHTLNKEPTIPLPLLSDDARKENNHVAVNILPPILETKVKETTVDNEERDHDSGFDQSAEYVVPTQPEDPMESVPALTSENPDSGSSFVVMSAIPPPEDFETCPITPPVDFANPTFPPPAEFVTSTDYEPEKPRKKLGVSDSLFPWMHEPPAPLDAVVPLAVPKPEEDKVESEAEPSPPPVPGKGQLSGGDSIKVEPDDVQYLVSSSEHVKQKAVVARYIHEDLSDEEFVKRYIESPQKTESEVKVISDPTGKAMHLELHSTDTVTDIPRLLTEQDKEMVSVQKVKTSVSEETDGSETTQEKQLVSPKPAKEVNSIQRVGEAEVLLEVQETTDVFIQEDRKHKEPNGPKFPVTPVPLPAKAEVQVAPSEDNIVTADALKSEVLENKKDVQERPEAETNRKPVRLVMESENGSKCDIFSKEQISLEREVPTEASTKKDAEKPFKPAKSIVPEKPDVRHSSQNVVMTTPETKEPMSKTVEQKNVQIEERQNPWATADTTREKNIESVVNTRVEEGAPPARKSIVLETLVTPETKPITCMNDPMKDLQARLTELYKVHVPSSHSSDCQNTAVVTLDVDEAVEKKEDTVLEDVIVPETKRVEFASPVRLGEQLYHLREDYKSTNKAAALDNTRQSPQPENNNPPTEGAGELSTLSGSPESAGPRPQSSSPPAVSPVSTSLPSPPPTPKNDVQNNEPSKSGLPVSEAERSSPLDKVTLKDGSHPKPVSVEKVERTSNVVKSLPSTVQPKQENTKARERVPTKLQRPLSLPTDLYHKTGLLESEKRSKQSLESSPSVSLDVTPASSTPSPRPPPITMPSFRRYSDLAADLNFVSSAAKVAEKGAETKELPVKPPNLALKGNSLTAVERPHSWVGPESESKRRSLVLSSAFRPVSFGEKGMKAVRPVEFAVKPVPLKQSATPTVSTSTDANVVTSNDVKSNQSEQKTPSNVEIMAAPPSLPRKKNIATPPVPVLAKSDESYIRSSRSGTSTVVQTSDDPKADHTEAPVKKYEIIFSSKPATQENSVDQKENSGSKVEKFGKGKVHSVISQSKYSVFSGAANASSRDFQSVSVNSETKREDKAMKERPQSVIVHGTKFQILPGKEEPSTTKENKNVRGEVVPTKTPGQPANIDKSSVPWKPASDHSKSDLRQSTSKTQQPPKAPNQLPPVVVMRPKTAHDPTKRLSLPTYIIEQADGQPSKRKVGNMEGKLTFVREQADTETAVVPQGVVAAMRALRETNEAAKGN